MANALRTNQEDGEKFFILNCIKSSFCLKDVMVAEYMSLKKNLIKYEIMGVASTKKIMIN